MKRTVCLLLLMILPVLTQAQIELKKTSLAPYGGSNVQGSLQVVSVAGEVFNKEVDQSGIHLSEGFVGADLLESLQVVDYQILTGLQAFPNPVVDYLKLQFDNSEHYEIYLFDLSGKLVFHIEIDETQWLIDMKKLPSATYVLSVVDRKNHTYRQLKILKN